jgi:hypothetical protein
MATVSSSTNENIPVLPETHSGIPLRLLEKAANTKNLLRDGTTKQTSERQRILVVPRGIDREKFLEALAEISDILSPEHVEINDKPLVDGW